MNVWDFDGTVQVDHEADLLNRLRSARQGSFGAFVLSHDDAGPALWGHINGDVAYLHFFPDQSGGHPGFQPVMKSPPSCGDRVRFLQIDGSEADSFDMPRGTLIDLETAYKAAGEFLRNPSLPTSVNWIEL